MSKCEKSPDGVHAIKYGPDDIRLVREGKISMAEYKKGQFCIYCGKAIW